MSIDARIQQVVVCEDGSGHLMLRDRPGRHTGDHDGIAGQNNLYFDSAPAQVARLAGQNIWGGDGQILLGEEKIAERKGYTRIVFVDEKKFAEILARWSVER